MLLGLAGSLLKTLGKKKAKKSGKQIAENITNQPKTEVDKNQNPTTVFHESGADIKPLEDIRDDMKGSSKKSKDPLNLALDGIDNALFGIIDTLGNIEKKKLDMADESAKAQQAKKKTLRERFLESGVVNSVVGSVKGAVGKSWDKFMQFLTWTFIGAIVNAIIKNWDEIQVEIEKVIKQIKGLYKNLEPILKALVGFGKWIVIHGIKLMKTISPEDLERTDRETEELQKLLDEMGLLEKEANDLLRLVEDLNAEDPKMKEFLNDYNNAKTDEEKKELLDNFISENQTVWDPKTFIEDPNNPGETLRFSETFGGPPDKEDSASIINEETGEESTYSISEVEEWKDKYYVDQHGNVRHKSTNGKAFGARMFPPEGLEYEQIIKMLEKRIYDKKTNTSKLIGESNEQSSIFNLRDSAFNTNSFIGKDIESRTYDLESISKYFDESNIDTTILITGQESSSSFSQVSPFIFSPSGGEDSFTIDEAQLLKLYKE